LGKIGQDPPVNRGESAREVPTHCRLLCWDDSSTVWRRIPARLFGRHRRLRAVPWICRRLFLFGIAFGFPVTRIALAVALDFDFALDRIAADLAVVFGGDLVSI